MLTPLDPAALQALARPTEAELIEAATVIAMLRNGVECSTNAPDPAAVVRDLLAAANSWLQHGDAAVRERDALRAVIEKVRAEHALVDEASRKYDMKVNTYPETSAALNASEEALRSTLALFDEVPRAK